MTENTAASNPRTQAELELVAKAWKDDAFKQALLSNPKAALEQELGTTLPADLTMKVVEAKPNHFYLRLPAKPEMADSLPLSDLVQSLSQTDGEAIATLIARSWKDAVFKQSLLSDPKAALADAVGAELPAELTVKVLEEDASILVMVLPMKPDASTVELSDEELEAVAGGTLQAIGKTVFPYIGTAAAEGTRNAATTATQAGMKVAASVAASTTVAAILTTGAVNQMLPEKFW